MKTADVGKFFTDSYGDVWQMISSCDQPTATMQKVGSNERVGGAIGSLNLCQFDLIQDENAQKLLKKAISQTEPTNE